MCEDKRNTLLDINIALIRAKLLLLELQSHTENSAYGKVRWSGKVPFLDIAHGNSTSANCGELEGFWRF